MPSTPRAALFSLARPHVLPVREDHLTFIGEALSREEEGARGLRPRATGLARAGRQRQAHAARREMHGTRASGISIDDVRGVVNCAQDAERGPAAPSWFVAADSASPSGLRRSRAKSSVTGRRTLRGVPGRRRVGAGRVAAAARRRRPAGGLARTFAEWHALSRCDHPVASRSGRDGRGPAVASRRVRYVGGRTRPAGGPTPGRHSRAARRGRGGARPRSWFACPLHALARRCSKSDGGNPWVLFCSPAPVRFGVKTTRCVAPQNPRFARQAALGTQQRELTLV